MSWNEIIDNIYVILMETEHPGNIGSVARAMKNMGLKNLILVNPAGFTKETYWLAHASEDIVDKSETVSSLEDALEKVEIVFGTSNKLRSWKKSSSIRDIAPEIIKTADFRKIGIVFGSERDGLSKDQLNLCDKIIHIPSFSSYPSYNLSQAVLIVMYELYSVDNKEFIDNEIELDFATNREKTDLTNHFYRTLESIEYFPMHHLKAWKSMKSLFLELLHDSKIKSKQIRMLHKYFKEVTRFGKTRSDSK